MSKENVKVVKKEIALLVSYLMNLISRSYVTFIIYIIANLILSKYELLGYNEPFPIFLPTLYLCRNY